MPRPILSARLARILFVLSLLLPCLSSIAHAGDFTIVNERYQTFRTSGTRNIYVKKVGAGHPAISVSLSGSSHFSKSVSSVIFSDSTSDTARYFQVSFSTTSADTTHATLVLHDSLTTDTVYFTGFDTSYTQSVTYDYTHSSFTSPIVRLGYSGTYCYGTLYNAQHVSESVSATLLGDSGWRFDSVGTTAITLTLDSTHDRTSGHQLVVYFHSTGKYLDTARLVLACSSPYSQRDTIRLIARDSNYIPVDSFDYAVSHTWPIARPHGGTGSTYSNLYNRQLHPLTVTATLLGDTAWRFNSLGDQSRSITLDSTHDRTSGRELVVYYRSIGRYLDTARLVLSCSSPYVQRDTIMLYSIDSVSSDTTSASSYHLGLSGPQFHDIEIGDTACGTIVIRNTNAIAMTVTSFAHSGSANWHWDSTQATPFTIPAHDSATFGLCYHNTECQSATSYAFRVNFQDTSHRIGYVSETFHESGLRCVESSTDTVRLSAIVGGYAEATVRYTNRDPRFDTLRQNHYFDSLAQWSAVGNPLPQSVALNSSVDVTLRFAPSQVGESHGYYNVYTAVGNGHATMLFGRGVGYSDSTLNLYNAETELIALHGPTSTITRTFYLRNNTSATVRATSVSLVDTTHFHILAVLPHAAPDTLAAGDTLGITLQLDADSAGFYRDSLIVTLDNSLVSTAFEIQAVREAVKSVRTVPSSGVALSIVPNPSTSPVAIGIDGSVTSRIEIYDLLGNRLQSASASSLVWDPAGIANGVYIVRATGSDTDGHAFAITKQLVVKR